MSQRVVAAISGDEATVPLESFAELKADWKMDKADLRTFMCDSHHLAPLFCVAVSSSRAAPSRCSAPVASALAPPRLLRSAGGTSELLVPVTDDLSLVLLEADATQQERLVDAALESDAPVGTKIDDPYGVVLWPAAQVVARELATDEVLLRGRTLLELGAGTGLVALAAAACGASAVLATDYREEPLELLQASAKRSSEFLGRPLRVETRLFDIKAEAEALPLVGGEAAHVVVAADLLYLRSTSVALARRCVEALRETACEAVIVGDLGRPGRDAFLAELVRGGVRADAAVFRAVDGWLPGTERHELVAATPGGGGGPRGVSVGLLRLVPGDLVDR